MNLRFIFRDGQKILQQYVQTDIKKVYSKEDAKGLILESNGYTYYIPVFEWVDVPLVGEDK